MKKFYIIYETKNIVNGKKYIGCHMTNDINDGYLGSGKLLKKSILKYGIQNFKRNIICFCKNEIEMLEKESEIVNEYIVNSKDYYNLQLGGGSNFSHINNNLDIYRHYFKNKVIVNDENGEKISIDKKDIKWISGELKPYNIGKILCKDKNDRALIVDENDERWLNGELVGINNDKHLVRNVRGECFIVDINDERLKNGEFVSFWLGRKHKEETKRKIGEKNSINQLGEKNSQYGTCWIYDKNSGENKKIKKCDINKWVSNGWSPGRKMK